VWPLLSDPRSQEAVVVAERFADENANSSEVEDARAASRAAFQELFTRLGRGNPTVQAASLAASLLWRNYDRRWQETIALLVWLGRRHEGRGLLSRTEQADAVRDVLGNPFQPAVVPAAWRTTTVLALAEGIYAEQAFDRLPILADSLQDAGCDNEDVLNHCRVPGTHCLGCWVVDRLLGKEHQRPNQSPRLPAQVKRRWG
jgi:hypothetical protein